MKKYILYMFILTIAAIACKNKNTDTPEGRNILGNKGGVTKKITDTKNNKKQTIFSEKVFALNKQANLLINERNRVSYHEAIKLLDKAIYLDSTYYMAYSNKVVALIKLKKYYEAIEVYEFFVTKIKQDYPEAHAMLGMLYDKLGEETKAKAYYKKAIQKYSERINKKSDLLDMLNKAHLIYILDKEEGLNKIDSLIKVYPENEELPLYREYMFLNYDHQQALDDL